MKTATLQTVPVQSEVLHRCHIIIDSQIQGNHHYAGVPQTDGIQISEALLPQIRMTAVLIAAMRHNFNDCSPDVFTEEADWFAARIIVFGVCCFHLDIGLTPMLKLANSRAAAFATRYKLPFMPATIRMSLHAGRPADLLIVDTVHCLHDYGNIVANSLALRRTLDIGIGWDNI